MTFGTLLGGAGLSLDLPLLLCMLLIKDSRNALPRGQQFDEPG
jgi:hypothetical protein